MTEVPTTRPWRLPSSERPYDGVSGWLLWFCLGLTVFSPLQFLWVSYREWIIALDHLSLVPIVLAEIIILAVIAMAGVLTGLALWRVWPHAVLYARLFLIGRTVAQWGQSFLLAWMMPTPEAAHRLLAAELPSAVGTTVICFVWFLYFLVSQRVRQTYGPEPA